MIKNCLFPLLISLLLSASAFADPLSLLTKQQGFFFFYSAACPHCQAFAPILKRFSQHHGFTVVAISMDGGFLPSFPDALMDEGQAQALQVNSLPALFLINPTTQLARLVSEGNIDEGELTTRLLKINEVQSKGGAG